MARRVLGITGTSKAGEAPIAPVAADLVDGNSVANNGETVIKAINTGGVSRTLSVPLTVTVDGQPVGPRTYSIAAGQTLIVGPFPTWWYGQTMHLNASSDEVYLSAMRIGEGLPGPVVPASAFALDYPALVANTDFSGLTVDGSVLMVDTATAGVSQDGNVLVVTV